MEAVFLHLLFDVEFFRQERLELVPVRLAVLVRLALSVIADGVENRDAQVGLPDVRFAHGLGHGQKRSNLRPEELHTAPIRARISLTKLHEMLVMVLHVLLEKFEKLLFLLGGKVVLPTPARVVSRRRVIANRRGRSLGGTVRGRFFRPERASRAEHSQNNTTDQ